MAIVLPDRPREKKAARILNPLSTALRREGYIVPRG
jgi:hypothetical protein